VDSERLLVTGALGCSGASAVKHLVDEVTPVWTYDLPGDPHRWRLIMTEEAIARVHFVAGDITDQVTFERAGAENGIIHIVYLAALQVPFVRADPVQGARVNVVGSTIVCETAKRHVDHVQGLAYASSAAVYGPVEMYPPGPLAHAAPLNPANLYGVFKQANEGTARIYWQDYSLHSIGPRPYVVYGPGRDQGMSSTPTKAMLAAALGRPYYISFGGTVVYPYAADAAAVFIRAARAAATCPSAPVFNMGGSTAHMAEVIAAIEATAPEITGKITFATATLSLPEEIDSQPLEVALGPTPWIPLPEAVRRTIAQFRQAVEAGKLNLERAIA
jgi:UDP-glucuronate 4-epimerase